MAFGFNQGVVGGYDPRMLSQRRSAILQKMMAQHAQNLPQNGVNGSTSGTNAVAQASHIQANGIGGRRVNAAKINLTGGQNLSSSILARLGLTVPRALPGEHSSYPGNAIDRTDVGGQMPNPNYRPSAQPAPVYPGDPTASISQAPMGAVDPQQAASASALGVTPQANMSPNDLNTQLAAQGQPTQSYPTTLTPAPQPSTISSAPQPSTISAGTAPNIFGDPNQPYTTPAYASPPSYTQPYDQSTPSLPSPYDPLLRIILAQGRSAFA